MLALDLKSYENASSYKKLPCFAYSRRRNKVFKKFSVSWLRMAWSTLAHLTTRVSPMFRKY